jgi:hypothetical protein
MLPSFFILCTPARESLKMSQSSCWSPNPRSDQRVFPVVGSEGTPSCSLRNVGTRRKGEERREEEQQEGVRRRNEGGERRVTLWILVVHESHKSVG